MAGQTSLVILNADRPRILKAGLGEMAKLEAMTGTNMINMDDCLQTFTGIRKAAYCFMLKDAKAHGEKLTIDKEVLEPGEIDIDDVLDEAGTFDVLVDKLRDAMGNYLSENKKTVKRQVKEAKNSQAAVPDQT